MGSKEEKDGNGNKQLRKWAVFTGLAFQMLATIGIAAYIGHLIDQRYPRSFPLFTVMLSIIGVFAALYTVFRQLKSINKNNPDD